MGTLVEAGQVIAAPFVEMGNNIILALPGIVAAFLIIILGYLIGALVGHIVKAFLEKTKLLKNIVNRMDLEEDVKKWNFEYMFGLITKWYIFLVFLPPAAEASKLPGFSAFLSKIALWVPNAILAIIIVMAGYIVAEYLAQKIRETRSKQKSVMASVTKVVTWIFVVLIALKQIGVDISVAENSFLIIVAGVVFGLALAFGLGFKDDAKTILKGLMKGL